jgi:hypothetical protein
MEPDTNDHENRTSWRSSSPTGLSMYRVGESLGTVWHDQDKKTWAATVNVGTRQATQYDFLSMKEAQVWCEDYIAQMQREAGE